MKILICLWVIVFIATMYYFIPKLVYYKQPGFKVKITRLRGWQQPIEITGITINWRRQGSDVKDISTENKSFPSTKIFFEEE